MGKGKSQARRRSPIPKSKSKGGKKPIEQYEHGDKKRLNNPPVGLVTPATDPIAPPTAKKKYEYDPHLDPQLRPHGRLRDPPDQPAPRGGDGDQDLGDVVLERERAELVDPPEHRHAPQA